MFLSFFFLLFSLCGFPSLVSVDRTRGQEKIRTHLLLPAHNPPGAHLASLPLLLLKHASTDGRDISVEQPRLYSKHGSDVALNDICQTVTRGLNLVRSVFIFGL